MNELFQIRLLLSQLAGNGFNSQQPLGPYNQQYYPPPPADYMGMVPRQHQPSIPTSTTTERSQLDRIQEAEPFVNQNETVKPNSTQTANNEIRTTVTETSVRADSNELISDPTPTIVGPTTRSISFKPVQTKSLKPAPNQIVRKK